MPTPNQQARKIVEQILGPQIKSTQEQYRNQGASLQAAYQALAKINEGVAPAIQGTYDAASARQSVIAKGFADGFRQASEKSAFDANALLAQQGSPQQVVSQGEAGGNALYGFGGAIPAGTLNQQGAAFTAAARFLPGQDRRLGIDAVKQAGIGGQAAVKELEAKRPALIQDALGQIADEQMKKDQLAFEAKVFGIKQGNEEFDQWLAKVREKRLQNQTDVSNAFRAAGLDISRKKLALAFAKERRLGKPKKKGGFTDKQLQDMRDRAVDSVEDARLGYYYDNGKKVLVDAKSPVKLLRDLLARGIPYSIVMDAIRLHSDTMLAWKPE